MFQLDDKFLEDLGLGNLPEEQKQAFLQQVYESLEERVGLQLSEGLSDAQLEEFEAIVDRKEDQVRAWLSANAPSFAQEPAFQQLVQAAGIPAEDIRVQAEYAATKWLELNRPNYRDVVASVIEELKGEISRDKDAILAASQQQ